MYGLLPYCSSPAYITVHYTGEQHADAYFWSCIPALCIVVHLTSQRAMEYVTEEKDPYCGITIIHAIYHDLSYIGKSPQ